MIKIAREGYPFIVFFFALSVISFFVWIWTFPVAFSLLLFMFFFFRDPERVIPEGEDIFVSPADGKIVMINEVREDRYLKKDLRMISIFMSPLDVHVNRSPCDGRVKSVIYSPGRFLSAFKHEASRENENITVVLDTGYGDIIVRQIAGFLARRAVCRVKEGDTLKRGDRFGIIKFSSRVDLFLPLNAAIRVRLGEKVKAGETIIAELEV